MADDVLFANGRGPAPRRKMYAAPFGSLQNATPPIQYGDASSGPAPSGGNALASSPQPIGSPFGALQGAPITPPPQFTVAPTGDPTTLQQGRLMSRDRSRTPSLMECPACPSTPPSATPPQPVGVVKIAYQTAARSRQRKSPARWRG
jgi:hypothetical protein